MIFRETTLKGAYIIELELLQDDRGFFTRSFCKKEFEEHSLDPHMVQCNISYNEKRGTLRGMHFQVSPHEEAQVVRWDDSAFIIVWPLPNPILPNRDKIFKDFD